MNIWIGNTLSFMLRNKEYFLIPVFLVGFVSAIWGLFHAFSATINILTLVAVLWYAWEARKTAKHMENTNKLTVLPFLNFIWTNENNVFLEKICLHITNEGKGVALNVEFDIETGTAYKVEFDRIGFLRPRGQQCIDHKLINTNTGNIDKEGILESPILCLLGLSPIAILARFNDMMGNKLEQKIIIDNDRISPQIIVYRD